MSRRAASPAGQRFPGTSRASIAARFSIRAATRLAGEENLADRIDFRVGDTQSLDLGAAEFDAVVAHTLISHVERPAAVLAEIARIAKPGGSIGIFDGDYASLTFGNPDPDQGKRDDEALIAAIVTNPRVMRQMPVLAREAGLDLVAYFPYVLAEVGKADFWRPAIESFRKLMPTAGSMTADEANAWARALAAGLGVGPLLRREQLLRIRPAQTVGMSAITDLFAGVPVSDLDASIDWYTRFFGRPPDSRVGDEVLWEIDEHAWLFIEPNAEQAGTGRITFAVAGLDGLLERLAAERIEHEPIETYSNGVRHVNVPDPDGNAIAFAEPPDAAGTLA